MKLDANHFYTTENLFYEIVETVKAKGKWNDKLIDYAIAHAPKNLYNYEFSSDFVLSAGGCEGYYLNLAIYGCSGMETNKKETVSLGTIKTLSEDDEAIREMAELYGECLIAYKKIINKHMDDLTRIGFDVDFYKGDEWEGGYSGFSTKEKAIERVKTVFANNKYGYTKAVIRDNLSRKEKEMVA